jgi:hypothetical protein
MHITGVTFPLEGLTINKVLSLNLTACKHKIEELSRTAKGVSLRLAFGSESLPAVF